MLKLIPNHTIYQPAAKALGVRKYFLSFKSILILLLENHNTLVSINTYFFYSLHMWNINVKQTTQLAALSNSVQKETD